MGRPSWIVDAAKATGYPVVLVEGWQGRGYSDGYDPEVVVMHHTAGPTSSGDMPSLNVVTYGRSDLPGPLCNYGLGRSGTIYVVADGKSNNAGTGDWDGFDSNYDTIGIEAENDGSQTWPTAQLESYDLLAAECIKRMNNDAGRVCSHAEWAEPPGRKYDPHGFNMGTHRSNVSDILEGDLPLNQADKDWLKSTIRDEVRWLSTTQKNDEGEQITQVGTAVLARSAMTGVRGSLSWAVREIYSKVVKPWEDVELDKDEIGPA